MKRSYATGARGGDAAHVITLSQLFPHPPAAVWDAFTDIRRLSTWFMPVEGDLRPGGRFQFKGNAGGTIESCTPEQQITATWEFGGGISWVTLDFAAEGQGTRLTLTHTAKAADMPPGFWDQYGPGATGVGWDLGFVGLGLLLDAPDAPRPENFEVEWVGSPQGRAYVIDSARDWTRAAIAGGQDADMAQRWAPELVAFYTGTPLADSER